MKKALIALVFPLVAHAQTADMNPKYAPYPASASPIKTEKAASFCAKPQSDGGYASAWMTSEDCHKWLGVKPADTRPQVGAYTKEHFDYCVKLSSLYSVVAAMRDSEMSPQQVYGTQAVHDFINKGIANQTAKTAINNAFFNADFAMPSWQLQQAVMKVCLAPNDWVPVQ
jgi:hypothetical protein